MDQTLIPLGPVDVAALPDALQAHPRAALFSRLGWGTVKIGRNTGVKYPGGDGFTLPDDQTVSRLLDLCLAGGVTVLDTAPAYGHAEERLGQLLGPRRDKFFLVSKTGEEYSNGQSEYIFTAAHTRASVERSLARLKTDYLDAVLVHSNRDDLAVVEKTDVLPTLQRLREEGKIGLIGVSTYTVAGGTAALAVADAVMVTYHRNYREEEPVIAAARQQGKVVLVKKALSSGHSADPAADLRFVLGTPGVTCAVIGSRSEKNIISNINALSGHPAGGTDL